MTRFEWKSARYWDLTLGFWPPSFKQSSRHVITWGKTHSKRWSRCLPLYPSTDNQLLVNLKSYGNHMLISHVLICLLNSKFKRISLGVAFFELSGRYLHSELLIPSLCWCRPEMFVFGTKTRGTKPNWKFPVTKTTAVHLAHAKMTTIIKRPHPHGHCIKFQVDRTKRELWKVSVDVLWKCKPTSAEAAHNVQWVRATTHGGRQRQGSVGLVHFESAFFQTPAQFEQSCKKRFLFVVFAANLVCQTLVWLGIFWMFCVLRSQDSQKCFGQICAASCWRVPLHSVWIAFQKFLSLIYIWCRICKGNR